MPDITTEASEFEKKNDTNVKDRTNRIMEGN